MPGHEVIGGKSQGKTERNRPGPGPKTRGISDKPNSENASHNIIGDTPFRPPLQQHLTAISSASPENRAVIIHQLQQTYGNRYVERLVKTVGSPNKAGPVARQPHAERPPEAAIQAKPGALGKQAETSTVPSGSASALVTEETYLFRPNLKGNAPRPAGFAGNRIDDKLKKGEFLELFDTVSPANKPKWQLARHPRTEEKGFILINKVLTPKKQKAEPGAENGPELKDVTDALSDLFGGVSGTNDQAFQQAANIIILRDPKLAMSLTADSGNQSAKVDEVKNYVPWLSNALANPGTQVVATGASLASDFSGGLSGLIGMVQGMTTLFNSKSEAEEKTDAFFKANAGVVGMGASLVGMSGTVAGTVASATDKSSVWNQMSDAIAATLKPVGDALKTVKGAIDTTGLIVKDFIALFKKLRARAEIKISEVMSAFFEFAGSVAGTLKNAFNTAAGILQWLKTLPGVSTLLGIFGAIIDIVGGACDAIKNTIDLIAMGAEMKENKDKRQELEKDPDYKHTEANMLNKLNRISKTPVHSLKLTKDKKPDTGQIDEALREYEKRPAKDKTESTEKDYQDVKGYLVDRNLEEVLDKRVNRGWSRVPEFGMSITASIVSIASGLTSVISDIVAIATAPTGIGVAIKAITSIASGIVSGLLKTGKVIYNFGRTNLRNIKQKGRDKGWWGSKNKTSKAKDESRRRQTMIIMGMIYDLKGYDLSKKGTREEYKRVKLRIDATGVDLKTLFSKNGKPLEQAQEIYKAMGKRE